MLEWTHRIMKGSQQRLLGLRIIIYLMLSLVPFPIIAVSQTSGSIPSSKSVSDTLNQIPSSPQSVWLMAGLSLDIVDPSVGNDLNILGYSAKFGLSWRDMTLLFTTHATKGVPDSTTTEEHRYDYALLFGFSHRSENSLFNAGVGISDVDYFLKGNLITPPTNYNSNNGVYQWNSGLSYGPAAMISYYFTRSIYEGAGIGIGFDLYGRLAQRASYFALELTILEFNIPIPLQ
jgi:hypothetical protein